MHSCDFCSVVLSVFKFFTVSFHVTFDGTHLKSLAALQRSPLFRKHEARFLKAAAGTSEITPVVQMI